MTTVRQNLQRRTVQDLTATPADLRSLPHWVVWAYRKREDGKLTKVPFQALNPQSKASSTDPATWASADEALACYEAHSDYAKLNPQPWLSGVGVVMTPDMGMVGVDLDDVRNPATGEIQAWALEVVKDLNTYTEVSPSGCGLRLFARGTLEHLSGRKRDQVEMYTDGRYLTITGAHLAGTPATIIEAQAAIDRLHAAYVAKPERERPTPTAAAQQPANLDDQEVLNAAFKSRNGDSIRRLWDGDTSAHDSDQSRADLALCSHLAFFADYDEHQVDRLFRQSGLMRAKWDELRGDATYGERTISEATAGKRPGDGYRGRGLARVTTTRSASEEGEGVPFDASAVPLEDAIATAVANPTPENTATVIQTLASEGASDVKAETIIRQLNAAGAGSLTALRADLKRARKARQERTRTPPRSTAGEYAIHGDVMCRVKERSTGGGEIITEHEPLANFRFNIVESVVLDDGVEPTRQYIVSGSSQNGRQLPARTIPAREYDSMNWATREWGTAAVPYAGMAQRDHLRAAGLLLSDPIERTVYTHTGWRVVDGKDVYLHAAGALGPDDDPPDAHVDLQGQLAAYVMPHRPTLEQAAAAMHTHLQLLTVAPPRIMAPILLAVYRAVLGDSDFVMHLFGRTGAGKSQLAALAQQASGADMTSDKLPGSFLSTANANEVLASDLKDELFVIDDFNPTGSRTDQDRYHANFERTGRAIGNSSGRGRLRPDGTRRPVRPPRALILTTGEENPKGHSLRARMIIIEVRPTDVDWQLLTSAQHAAAEGEYATARAGYISWLAGDLEGVRNTFKDHRHAERRAYTDKSAHPRTVDIAAQLMATWTAALRPYLETLPTFPKAKLDELGETLRAGVLATVAVQADHQNAADPVNHFLGLMTALVTSGRGHLADVHGGHLDGSWGWRETPNQTGYAPQGVRLGWHAGKEVYLNPDTVFAEANRLGEAQNEPIPLTKQTLWKRMAERGLIQVTVEAGRTRYTPKRSVEGVSRRVLVLPISTLREVGNVGSNDEESDEQAIKLLPTSENDVGKVGAPQRNVGNRPEPTMAEIDQRASWPARRTAPEGIPQ